ncbi:nuclear transport factor 2 family protein [Nonomuraea lactucae]|uniref:nuclear transport factor 2 family protein n=1 Tax=Nonomuraea lactucae TaxID=2249762 RepID=UPI000DE4CD42|nr:nuclear transport factor 2 family protein [Nonomuraea lactucae]
MTDSDDSRRQRTRDTFATLIRLLREHDMQGFARMWAPDGMMEFPFAVGEQPRRIEGRAAVEQYLAHYTDMVDVRDVTVHAVHDLLDPGTIVVEFDAAGIVVSTGRPYRMPYIAVIRVGDEGVESYRDYWTLAVVADALRPADEQPGTPA